MANLAREPDGTLPRFGMPGRYPMIYLTADGGILCPDCANGKNGSRAADKDIDPERGDDDQWRIVAQDIFWEGRPTTCDHCEKEIESAYGDPEQED